MSAIRVRFAPSPTGHLHLGGLRTALFNYLFAKKHGGSLLLRIEDTDQTRSSSDSYQSLVEMLAWSGLGFDESPSKGGAFGPYIQSARLSIYKTHVAALLSSKGAYKCYCSKEELGQKKAAAWTPYDRTCLSLSPVLRRSYELSNQAYVVRFLNNTSQSDSAGGNSFQDLVFGRQVFSPHSKEDFILIKSDGWPTYHFANVVDDHLMGISHVIRGQEWLLSTPYHLALYSSFKWTPPKFAHLPLLINSDGSKLSKRNQSTQISHYKNSGYLPLALINSVALMGWNPPSQPTEILSLEQLSEQFSLERLNTNLSNVSHIKLDYFNKKAIQVLSQDQGCGSEILLDQLKAAFQLPANQSLLAESEFTRNDQYLSQVIAVLKERINNIHCIPQFGSYFFREPKLDSTVLQNTLKETCLSVPQCLDFLSNFAQAFSLVPERDFDLPSIETALSNSIAQTLLSHSTTTKKNLLLFLRLVLSGTTIGAPLSPTIRLIQKPRVLKRLESASSVLTNLPSSEPDS